MAHLAVGVDSRAEFRDGLGVGLGLDASGDPACKLEVTVLVGCYESAKGRFE